MSQRTSVSILLIAALGFSIPLSWHLYETNRFMFHDLGLVNYFLDSTIHGYFMRSPLPEDYSHFAVHVHPTLFVLLPFKLIWQNSFVLIFGQIFLQALAIIPLYFLARSLSASRVLPWLAIVFFFANKYVMESFLSAHYEQLYIAPMLGVFAFLARGHTRWAWVMLILAFGVRDDYAFLTGLSAAGIGIFDRKNRGFWWQAACAGVAWFLAARALIMPHMYNPNKVFATILMDHWGAYGKTIPEVMLYFATHPLWILSEIWFHSDYRMFLAEHGWFTILSPFGIGTLTPMSYLVTYKSTAGRLEYYFSCSMLPFALAGNVWVLAKAHALISSRWKKPLMTMAACTVLFQLQHNYKYHNRNGDQICFPWNCHKRYPMDNNEAFANATIETFINQSNQSAAVTLRHFNRAKWRRDLVLNSSALTLKSCWIFADADEGERFLFLGTQNLVADLRQNSEYRVVAEKNKYTLFYRKTCDL